LDNLLACRLTVGAGLLQREVEVTCDGAGVVS